MDRWRRNRIFTLKRDWWKSVGHYLYNFFLGGGKYSFSLPLHFMLLKFCGKKKKEIEFVDTFKRLSDQSKGVERGIVEDVKRSKGNDGWPKCKREESKKHRDTEKWERIKSAKRRLDSFEWCESRQAKRRAIIIKTKEKLDRGIVKEGLEGVLRKNKQVLSRSKNKIRLRKDNK